MAQVSRRLGRGLFALGVLVLVQPAPSVGATSGVTAIGASAVPRSGPTSGQPPTPGRVASPTRTAASGRTTASGQHTPPPGQLPEPASNRAYGLPVALAMVAAGGVLSLLVRVLLAEGSPPQRSGAGPDRSAD